MLKRLNLNCDFSNEEYERFEKECNFNKFNGEYDVYKLLKDGASIAQISMKLSITERTVSRRILSIKLKILKVIK